MASILKIQGAEDKQRGVHYEVDSELEPIGVGGMGQVFKGQRVDERTGVRQDVAIKFLYDDLPPIAIERSRREASVQIDSENLLKMYGFIEAEGHYHVASELLYGVKLSDLLQGELNGPDGKPMELAEKLYLQYKQQPEEFARYIVKNLLSGVMALHDKGYIHRDIDPSNIMLTADGKVKLIDFGIAKKLTEVQGENAHLTTAGQFMGKAAYASPELVLGDVAHEDFTTDLYAVGIVLFQLLTGKLPFDGPRQEVLDAQLKTAPPVDLIKNSKMRAVVSKALAKKQSDRYQSAAIFRAELEQTVESKKQINLNWKLVGGVAAGVVAVIVALVIILSPKEPKPVVTSVPVDPEPEETVVEEAAPGAEWLTEQAITKLQAGQTSEGVELLEQAIQKDSASSALANAIMASLYSHEGAFTDLNLQSPYEISYQRAYSYANKAYQQDSTCYYARYELGYTYISRYDQIMAGERNARKGVAHLKASEKWARIKGNTAFADFVKSKFE